MIYSDGLFVENMEFIITHYQKIMEGPRLSVLRNLLEDRSSGEKDLQMKFQFKNYIHFFNVLLFSFFLTMYLYKNAF